MTANGNWSLCELPANAGFKLRAARDVTYVYLIAGRQLQTTN